MSRRGGNNSMFLNKNNYYTRKSADENDTLLHKSFMKNLTNILRRTDKNVNSKINRYKDLYENGQKKSSRICK